MLRKKTILLAGIAALVLVSAFTLLRDHPDLTGHWTINNEKSDLDGAAPDSILTIDITKVNNGYSLARVAYQHGNPLRIVNNDTLFLDGVTRSYSRFDNGMSTLWSDKSAWNAAGDEIDFRRESQFTAGSDRPTKFTATANYKLSDGNKTLTISWESQQNDGNHDWTEVFEKP